VFRLLHVVPSAVPQRFPLFTSPRTLSHAILEHSGAISFYLVPLFRLNHFDFRRTPAMFEILKKF